MYESPMMRLHSPGSSVGSQGRWARWKLRNSSVCTETLLGVSGSLITGSHVPSGSPAMRTVPTGRPSR